MVEMPLQLSGQLAWETIRDCKVKEMEIASRVELARLQEQERLLETRRGQVETELNRIGESEANVRVHRTTASWWLRFFILSVVVSILSAYWSVSWYLGLSWEKFLLAFSLFVLPLIGWMVFLVYGRPPDQEHRRLLAGLGLLIVVCSIIAAATLSVGRGIGTNLEEERLQGALSQQSEDLSATETASTEAFVHRARRIKTILAVTAMISVIVLAVAGEVAAGLAFHAYIHRMTVVWTSEPYFLEHRSVLGHLADNRSEQEDVRLRPQRLFAQLTREGVEESLREVRAQATALRMREEKEREAARAREEREKYENSLPYLLKRVLIPIGIALALVLGLVVYAMAADTSRNTTVIILDLSSSTGRQEFDQNVKAVEGLLKRFKDGRVVVIVINQASLASAPIFSDTAPVETGRFGEHLDAWRNNAVKKWRAVGTTLSPSADGSDIFGAIARAALEFASGDKTNKRLIIFSDMQHVGHGLNFERLIVDPKQTLDEVERKRLNASLQGASVWVLGAQPSASLAHWTNLKEFWVRFFDRGGATLKAFSPNRLFGEPI